MADKKTPTKKSVKSAAKTPVLHLSDKEFVLKTEEEAVCLSIKTGFIVFDEKKEGKPLHSGIAKTELNAWKLAAHNL